MIDVSRRTFVMGLAAAAVLPAPQCQPSDLPPLPPLPAQPFTLGVASGEPGPTGMVLWTRLAPEPLSGGGMPADPVPVSWEVALDEGFSEIAATATTIAPPEFAHSVHVRVIGLQPDTWYWYRFHAGEWTSPVGRTRTTPHPDSDPTNLRFAVATCQHWSRGYYSAHQNMAEEDLDLVVFVGDYIYEGNASGPRTHGTPTAFNLADYRNRHALYKTDPSLQAAHAAFPWMVTWDDHEVVNNYAGDADSTGVSTAAFLARRAAAYQAWWEHQPVIFPGGLSPDPEIYRMLTWGRLARLALVDGRQYRTPYGCGSGLGPLCSAMTGPEVTMLGATQEQWLADTWTAAPATWHALAQQTVFTPGAPDALGTAVNLDQWDGYPAARQRMLDLFEDPAVTNPIVLTGDLHAAIAGDVHRDGNVATPRLATEFVAPSISSTFGTVPPASFEAALSTRPYVRHVNATDRGYLVCDVTPETWEGRFRVVDALSPTSAVTTDAVVTVAADPLL